MNTVVIVQARMTSTRLPGKVLLPILGRPMLSFQLERLRRVRCVDAVVVATTTNPADDEIVQLCAAEKVNCTRGSESDVLSRYYDAAVASKAELVVRVTSDCPLIDPAVVQRVLLDFLQPKGGYDYASNMITPTFPYGMAAEVVSFAALREAHEEALDPAEREHVTPFIYWRPARYRIRSVTMAPDLSHHRWTVDTPEDFSLVSQIFTALYPQQPDFSLADVLALLKEHPHWELVNQHVQQKTLSQPRREQ